MKTSPKVMANIYFIMGILFVYMATQSAGETVWNSSTILLAIIATLDFGVAIRLMRNHMRNKEKTK
ncbi:YdiK family protein [Virgibacillus sp. DJP39]|uniref:YdiK family protein n=1 Tax=Virgibacillus sp. DJP39 TaxID=3409790 RepID=UPI003BB4C5F9